MRRGPAAVVACVSALTVLTTAGPAAASSAHAPVDGSQIACTSERPGLASRLSQDISGALRGRDAAASALALYDRRTATTCELNAEKAFDSASVVKVTVLGALLRRAMEEHRTLTPREVALTTAMITKSDNDATAVLWRRLGPESFQHFLDLAGMRNTVPGGHGLWGLTQTTAGDQVKLLRLLTSDNSVLDAASRSYALVMMNRVVPDQRWGAPAGAPRTATVHVKNGWLPRATDGWRVHSVGAFTNGGHDYGIAALSQGNRTMADGVNATERVSRVVHRDLSGAR